MAKNMQSVLSLKKASKILRRMERQIFEDFRFSYPSVCTAENGEPLYDAEGLMRQIAYYIEDAKMEVMKEIEIHPLRIV